MTQPVTDQAKNNLDRDRVVTAAITVADRDGTDSLTIRRIAAELGSSPMSIYHYVSDKDEILDAMVDRVYDQIGSPQTGVGWRIALRERAHSARRVFQQHPWAVALMDSRTSPGAATFEHQDRLIGFLRDAGLSFAMIGHAIAALDAYVYGFAIQENALPFNGPDEVEKVVGSILEAAADDYPNLMAMAVEHVLQPGYDFGNEFEYGLDLVLDGLEAAQARS